MGALVSMDGEVVVFDQRPESSERMSPVGTLGTVPGQAQCVLRPWGEDLCLRSSMEAGVALRVADWRLAWCELGSCGG